MQVGIVGVGTMGGPIAANLARAGHDVLAYDLDPAALASLAAHGVGNCTSSADAGRGRDIVHVVVFTDEQVREAVMGVDGNGGLISTMSPGATIVVHSTVRPQTCIDLADRASASQIDLIDAAMTGTVAAANDGTLTLLVGGRADVVERCAPEFEAFSQRLVHVGSTGTGALAKIINNVLVLANAEALRECIALAAAAGTHESTILEVVNASTSQSWVSAHWDAVRPTVDDVADPHNLAPMSTKDCGLAREAATQYGSQLEIGELVQDRLAHIVRP